MIGILSRVGAPCGRPESRTARIESPGGRRPPLHRVAGSPARSRVALYHSLPMKSRAVLLILLVVLGCGVENADPPGPPVAASLELSDVMLKLQIHQNKLWFAGAAGNWDLARFYLDEIEEDIQPMVGANLMEGETNVSEIMETTIPPLLDALRTAAADRDAAAFSSRYLDLVQGCNACHRSSGLGFVVIQRPTAPFMDNQEF